VFCKSHLDQYYLPCTCNNSVCKERCELPSPTAQNGNPTRQIYHPRCINFLHIILQINITVSLERNASDEGTEGRTQRNKKFWEELMIYFPWYDTDRTENDASNNSFIVAYVFVATVMFLPSRCLVTIATQTDGRDVWSTSLRRAQVAWYKYQVS
jgi:hypothetical protein